ncbi:OmpA family protein [Rhodospirillaceae bacterium RKSG073]|nr:OmpA family protein [Curvivirga aplysinae]
MRFQKLLIIVFTGFILAGCLTGKSEPSNQPTAQTQSPDNRWRIECLGLYPKFRIDLKRILRSPNIKKLDQACITVKRQFDQADLNSVTVEPISISVGDLEQKHLVWKYVVEGQDLFVPGREELSSKLKNDLQKLAGIISKEKFLLVVGHTDASGGAKQNQILSELRAMEVGKVLKQQGFKSDRLQVLGAGEVSPRYSNETADNRALNRRVEVFEITQQVSSAFIADIAAHLAQEDDRSHDFKAAPLETVVKRNQIQFKGLRVRADSAAISDHVGELEGKGLFNISLFKSAQASVPEENMNIACIASGFSDYRSEASGFKEQYDFEEDVDTDDFMPGLYGTSWYDNDMDGNLVAITQVAVLEDEGLLQKKPHFLLYRDYKQGQGKKPDLDLEAHAFAVVGEKGVLYRVFLPQNKFNFICADLVFPRNGKRETSYGKVYFQARQQTYSADIKPVMAK